MKTLPCPFAGVMAPFIDFAVNTEKLITWPHASYEKPKLRVAATEQDKAMLELYYTLAVAHLWKDKAPNVDLFPGTV